MYFIKEGFILPIHHDCGSFVGNGSTVMGKEESEPERAFSCNCKFHVVKGAICKWKSRIPNAGIISSPISSFP